MQKPVLTEAEIERLLQEPKPIPFGYRRWLRVRKERNRKRVKGKQEVKGEHGNTFLLDVSSAADFDPVTGKFTSLRTQFHVLISLHRGDHRYNLIRCDCHRSPHTNHYENQQKVGVRRIPPGQPHIHRITERYQYEVRKGTPRVVEEQYAEPTYEFQTWKEALSFAIDRYGFILTGGPHDTEFPLLEGLGHDD